MDRVRGHATTRCRTDAYLCIVSPGECVAHATRQQRERRVHRSQTTAQPATPHQWGTGAAAVITTAHCATKRAHRGSTTASAVRRPSAASPYNAGDSVRAQATATPEAPAAPWPTPLRLPLASHRNRRPPTHTRALGPPSAARLPVVAPQCGPRASGIPRCAASQSLSALSRAADTPPPRQRG